MTFDRTPYTGGLPGFRNGAPNTSSAAAISVEKFAASIRAKTFCLVRDAGERGLIGDDVADALDLHVTQVRSRLSELHADKKIADSGRRRRGHSGRMGAVWVLPEFGPEQDAEVSE